MLNEIYRDLWCQFRNFFMPTVKDIWKERIGSRIKKTYETPRTPKEALRLRYEALDPIELSMGIIRSEEQSEELKIAA